MLGIAGIDDAKPFHIKDRCKNCEDLDIAAIAR
jgi:hypothetical protein